jgi:hypothetical protein
MAFDFASFARLRPYLYHLTSFENLARLQRTKTLYSARALAEQANRFDVLEARRPTHEAIVIDGEMVFIRDQRPLHKGNMRLMGQWSFEQFLSSLNDRVFFWPGDETRPISYGRRHFERYEQEDSAILRLRFASLVEANPNALPLFSKCNSGSPRWSRGVAGDRGPHTFVKASEASFGPANVVEVTFLRSVVLPETTEWASTIAGPWSTL